MAPNPDYGEISPSEYLRDKDRQTRRQVGLDALVRFKVLQPIRIKPYELTKMSSADPVKRFAKIVVAQDVALLGGKRSTFNPLPTNDG